MKLVRCARNYLERKRHRVSIDADLCNTPFEFCVLHAPYLYSPV